MYLRAGKTKKFSVFHVENGNTRAYPSLKLRTVTPPHTLGCIERRYGVFQ